MKWISWALIFAVTTVIFTEQAHASRTSFHTSNPFGWAHLMPAGETPGWSEKSWINFELSHSNIWNTETTILLKDRNNETVTLLADFEQTSALLEIGRAVSERWAVSLLIPYANRSGGFLDNFIDDFHVFIGSHRFGRNHTKEDQSTYSIESNGNSRVKYGEGGDLSNLKLKLKYWMWKLESSTKGECNCGLALGAHVKAPLGSAENGFTSGEWDYSGTLHLGLPLWKDSGAYASTALTYISPNEITKDWPVKTWHQMYELSLDLGFTKGWGVVLTGRMESPWLEKGHVEYQSSYTDPKYIRAERISSAWNGLVHWRGSQSIGIRYRSTSKFNTSLHIVEDWALGNFDEDGDDLYSNNAPDVSFVFKLGTSF